jgi:hypothetical protein
MMALVERLRTMPMDGIDAPTLVVYSRHEEVVDATETERVCGDAAASAERGACEQASDPAAHVLAGEIMSPGSTDEVLDIVLDFLGRAGVEGSGLAAPGGPAGEPR